MASTKFIMSEEEKAAADILIKAEAEKKAVALFEGHGTRTQGLVYNNINGRKSLLLQDQHNWSENAVVDYPKVIYASQFGQPTIFVHQGALPMGSKGGVVYADGEDSTARKWVVAFDSVNNKAYVEAGPIGPVDWNVVGIKLSHSGSSSEYEDPVFHGKASADIRIETFTSLLFVRFDN